MDDAEALERAMDRAVMRLHYAATRREREQAWAELKRLHAQRSAAQVARMEAGMRSC